MGKKKKPNAFRKLSAKEKVAKIERLIAALELALPDAPLREAGQIERQIRLHRENLRIEMTHMVSKINKVKHRKVPGSYGSGNR